METKEGMDDSSRYALGALFSLALHLQEVRAGAAHIRNRQVPWGQHEQKIVVTTSDDQEELQSKMARLWDAYWGYDLVHAEGLLDRTLTKLGITDSSWAGLKVLPEVAAQAGYSALVQQYRAILDPSLKGVPAPELSAMPPINKAEEQRGMDQAASSETWAVPEDDEDLWADLQRSRIYSPSQQDLQEPADLSGMSIKDTSDADADFLGIGSHSGGAGQSEPSSSIQDMKQELHEVDDAVPASQLAARTAGAPGPSAEGLVGVTELLDACVANLEIMPQLDDVVKVDESGKSAPRNAARTEQRGAEKAANVRWYDSRSREALRLVAEWLQVPWDKVVLYECLLVQQAQAPETKGDGKKQLTLKEKRMRALKIGAAAAGGGALLAITGGLAAPALAAVAGSVFTTVGGSAAAAGAVTGFMGSTVGAAAVIGGFGAGGAHVVGGKMARRVGDVKEFGFRSIPDDENYRSYFSAAIPSGEAAESASTPQPATETTPSRASQNAGRRQQNAKGPSKQAADQSSSSWFGWSKKPEPEAIPLLPIPVAAKARADPKLSRTIAVAGWIAEPDDFVDLWRGLSSKDSERFSLVWETKELMELNNSIMDMLLSKAYSAAGMYLIENFVIHGLVGAVALPMTVLNVSGLIDSTWAVVMNRAARAGELLAHVLTSGAHGDCPVTLIGNSMGARLIFHCLLELCRCKCKGIVQHAVMLGTPADIIKERWVMARSVVSGRCVNGYSKEDWVLALSFRARQGTFRPAAGLGAIPVPGVENVDLTDLVHGHGDYVKQMDAVLDRLGFAQSSQPQKGM